MTTKEAAAFLRVHMVTLSQWAKKGYVPGVKVGKNWRFSRPKLTAWLNDPHRRFQAVSTGSELASENRQFSGAGS
ncbi:MAG: helix-turn-helix domain-containing protein [Thermodesulfobacteriota bacterium]